MRQLLRIIFATVLFTSQAYADMTNTDRGVITIPSAFDVSTTADRLESVLKKKGMTVFARINHTEGAARVGLKLRPTELVIFGNPKVGTPLMHCSQSVAIDLPQKALIWKDSGGKVWLSYNDPAYLSNRHGITGCAEVKKKITNALAKFSNAATSQ